MNPPNEPSPELKKRMEELNIEGFSSMGSFSNEEHLANLDEIERIIERRRFSPDSGGVPEKEPSAAH